MLMVTKSRQRDCSNLYNKFKDNSRWLVALHKDFDGHGFLPGALDALAIPYIDLSRFDSSSIPLYKPYPYVQTWLEDQEQTGKCWRHDPGVCAGSRAKASRSLPQRKILLGKMSWSSLPRTSWGENERERRLALERETQPSMLPFQPSNRGQGVARAKGGKRRGHMRQKPRAR